MFLIRSFVIALLSAALLSLAESPNPFKIPSGGISATAGQPLDLSWNPTTQGTVTLVLRSGASSNLAAGTVIASSIANSGSYTWTPDTQITRGSDYTVEIVDDSDPSQTNFTPYFVLDSDNTVAYSTSQVTLGATSASSALSTASATGSAMSVPAAISSASVSSASASAASASTGSASGSTVSAASTTAVSSTTDSVSGASTAQVSTKSTGTVSGASSGSSAASATSAASASASPETVSSAGAPRATAMAGMLGLAALGALAL